MNADLRIAGVAGGVGTTVAATVLGCVDAGTDTDGADVLVARNDYRCAKALQAVWTGQPVLLILEGGRALTEADLAAVLHHRATIVTTIIDPAVARADDAGLLDMGNRSAQRYHARLSALLAAVPA